MGVVHIKRLKPFRRSGDACCNGFAGDAGGDSVSAAIVDSLLGSPRKQSLSCAVFVMVVLAQETVCRKIMIILATLGMFMAHAK